MRLTAILLSACLLSGCAHSFMRDENQNRWRTIQDSHLKLLTDFDSTTARRAFETLSAEYRAIDAALGGVPEVEGEPVTIILFSSSIEFKSLHLVRQTSAIGFVRFFGWGNEQRPVMYMFGPPEEWHHERRRLSSPGDESTARHEFAHILLSRRFAGPHGRWFDEGFAAYLESLEVGPQPNTVIVGGANPGWWQAYLRSRVLRPQIRLGDLFDGRKWNSDVTSWAYYGTSWVLVHSLINERPAQWSVFLSLLSKGWWLEPAFRSAFPDYVFDELQQRLSQYAKHGQFAVVTVSPAREAASETQENGVSATDWSALKMMVFSANDDLPAVLEAVNAGLANDPNSVELHAMKTWLLPKEQRAPYARQRALDAPTSAIAWKVLASTLPSGTERIEAMKHSIAFDPDDSDTLNSLAWQYVLASQFAEAIPLARRSVVLAPEKPETLDTLANALGGVNQWPEAVELERQAQELAATRRGVKAATMYTTRLKALESHQLPVNEPEH